MALPLSAWGLVSWAKHTRNKSGPPEIWGDQILKWLVASERDFGSGTAIGFINGIEDLAIYGGWWEEIYTLTNSLNI